jgi:hypothetical protein
MWRRRTPQDARKRLKKRQKRQRAKRDRFDAVGATPVVTEASAEEAVLAAQDEWEPVATWRPAVALRSFALLAARGANAQCRVAALCADNSVCIARVTAVRCLS